MRTASDWRAVSAERWKADIGWKGGARATGGGLVVKEVSSTGERTVRGVAEALLEALHRQLPNRGGGRGAAAGTDGGMDRSRGQATPTEIAKPLLALLKPPRTMQTHPNEPACTPPPLGTHGHLSCIRYLKDI